MRKGSECPEVTTQKNNTRIIITCSEPTVMNLGRGRGHV